MKSLNNIEIKNKKIVLRADLNVPVVDGKISDYSRINSVLPSINLLCNNKNKIFIIAHYGRPKGQVNKKYSLEFLCNELKYILNKEKIYFLNEYNDGAIKSKIEEMKYGDICLFENIRFNKEEETNNPTFSKNLSQNFDFFVNDAFSASHRNHSSIVGLPKFLPAVAGISFVNEINNLEIFLKNAKKPNLAIIGGSKISTKIKVILNLITIFDSIVIGGAMANTFLYANNTKVGKSLVEEDYNIVVKDIQSKAKKSNCKIILPTDVVCSSDIKNIEDIRECNIDDVLDNQMILDIGKNTTELICNEIKNSRSVLWNGPLGAFEYKPFDESSLKIANTILNFSKDLNIDSIAGGGDTLSAINKTDAKEAFTFLSNAGGAFLEWLEGNKSPGAIALEKNEF